MRKIKKKYNFWIKLHQKRISTLTVKIKSPQVNIH
jgi:hypothetical protein